MKKTVSKFQAKSEVRLNQCYTSARAGHIICQSRIITGGDMGYKVMQVNTGKCLFESASMGEVKQFAANLQLYRF